MKCLCASQVRWRGTPCPACDFVNHLLRGCMYFILLLETHSDLGYCKYVTPSWGLKGDDDVFTTCCRTRSGSNLSCLLLRARPHDTAWAETEAFDYRRFADRSSYPSLRTQLVWIKSTQARQRFSQHLDLMICFCPIHICQGHTDVLTKFSQSAISRTVSYNGPGALLFKPLFFILLLP